MALGYFDNSADPLLMPFLDFVEHDDTQDFEGFRRMWFDHPDTRPPSLMDVIAGWVLYGNATHVCGSYETFLLSIITITDYWARGDNELRRWQGPNGEEQRVDVYCVDPTFPTGRRPDDDFPLLHDALNRTLWEVMRATSVRSQKDELLYKIERDRKP